MTKHRLQLDVTEETLNELDELKETTGMTNRGEVISQALGLLRWTVLETQKNDAMILIEKNGRQKQIVFPFWTPRSEKAAS